MTSKSRVKAIEKSITPPMGQKCIVVDWGDGSPIKCPMGRELTNGLQECKDCKEIREKDRHRLIVEWVSGGWTP